MKHFILIFAASFISLEAATWYLDNSLTSSANTGVSWANAWTNYASINNAGMATTDTLEWSGGPAGGSQNYPPGFQAAKAGTSTNAMFTYKASQDVGHNGKVVLDGANTNNFGGLNSIFINGNNYTVVDGGPSTNFIFANAVNSAVTRDVGTGYYSGIAVGQRVTGINISNVNNGVYFSSPGAGIILFSNIFQQVKGDTAVAMSGHIDDNFDNIVVEKSTILLVSDMSGSNGGPDGVTGGSGITVRNCFIKANHGSPTPGQHPDGTQTLARYFRFYNNQCWNFINSGVKSEPTAPENQWLEIYIYNNIFGIDDSVLRTNTAQLPKGTELGSSATVTNVHNVFICNNLFVDITALGINGGNGTWPTFQPYYMMNNVFYNVGTNISANSIMGNSNVVFDFNCSVAGVGGKTNYIIDLPGNGVFTPYVQTNGLSSFAFTSYTPFAGANNNYTPTINTTGYNLSAYLGNLDMLGNVRSSWTVGPIEFSGAPPPPSGNGGVIVKGKPQIKGKGKVK